MTRDPLPASRHPSPEPQPGPQPNPQPKPQPSAQPSAQPSFGSDPGVPRPDPSQNGPGRSESWPGGGVAAPTGLGRLYVRGAVRSVRLAATRGRPIDPGALPARELVVHGVRPGGDRLTAYQHLIGEPGTDVLPAGFVHVLAFPVATALMVERDFPLPLLGMVHLANRVTQHRPVRLGETLDVAVHARDLMAHRSGVSVELVARVRSSDELVWEGVSTYLAKGARLIGDSAPPAVAPRTGAPHARQSGPGSDGSAADPAYPDPAYPEVAPAPTGLWRLGRDVGHSYAAVSGDRNPIHTSRPAARAFGFRGPIAHGMYTAARALAAVGAARGPAFTWEVRFAKPVLLPATVPVRVAADDGGFVVEGWDARSGRNHLTVEVRPLTGG